MLPHRALMHVGFTSRSHLAHHGLASEATLQGGDPLSPIRRFARSPLHPFPASLVRMARVLHALLMLLRRRYVPVRLF
jgi:hypothetical protein